MHRRIYNSLQEKPKLQYKNINSTLVSGDALKTDGCINFTFTIGGTIMKHLFYVLPYMNRNLILDRLVASA